MLNSGFLSGWRKNLHWRKILPVLGLLAAVVVVAVSFKILGTYLGQTLQDDIERIMAGARDTPWGLPVVIAVFCGLGLTGFPQFLLIAATAVIFGAAHGLAYSWIATMISASLHFAVAKRFGNQLVRRYGGKKTNLFSQKVGDHGILASGLVRVIPSAPFIVVNATAGLSHMAYWKFAIGTGVGIVPKTVIVASMGGSFMSFLRSQDIKYLMLLILFMLFWVILGLVVRRYVMPKVRKSGLSDEIGLDGLGTAETALSQGGDERTRDGAAVGHAQADEKTPPLEQVRPGSCQTDSNVSAAANINFPVREGEAAAPRPVEGKAAG